jgi:hypothetical protein
MPLLNDFGFGVVGGQENNGYVALDSGNKYKLKLWNFNTKLRCDAEVIIDGKAIGIFRIDKMDSIVIERPINDRGCFTFYASGTIESKMVMLDAIDENNLGLIEVAFYPEKRLLLQEQYALQDKELECLRCQIDFDDELASMKRQLAGGTGLSGYSSTNYDKVEFLNHDYDNIVTIYLRLISNKSKPISLQQETNFSSPILASIQNKQDAELNTWIACQKVKLMEEQAILMKEQSLLKASMDKNKFLNAQEELMNWVAEEKQIAEEYRKKVGCMEDEETEEELVDYWKFD